MHGSTWKQLCQIASDGESLCDGESLDELLHSLYRGYLDTATRRKELAKLKLFNEAVLHLEMAASAIEILGATRLPITFFGKSVPEMQQILAQARDLPSPLDYFNTTDIRGRAAKLKQWQELLAALKHDSQDQAIGMIYGYCAACIEKAHSRFRLTNQVIANLINEELGTGRDGGLDKEAIRSALRRERNRLDREKRSKSKNDKA